MQHTLIRGTSNGMVAIRHLDRSPGVSSRDSESMSLISYDNNEPIVKGLETPNILLWRQEGNQSPI